MAHTRTHTRELRYTHAWPPVHRGARRRGKRNTEQERRLRDRYRVKWESKFRVNRVPRVSVLGKSFLLFPIFLCIEIFYVDFFSVVVKWNIGDVFCLLEEI